MTKRFLHEIQTQLAMVKEHLNAIHVPKGPLARPLPPDLQERRQKLLARKRQLEEMIIWYEPEGEKSNPTERSPDNQANNNPGQTRLSKPGPAPGPAGSKGRGPADRGA